MMTNDLNGLTSLTRPPPSSTYRHPVLAHHFGSTSAAIQLPINPSNQTLYTLPIPPNSLLRPLRRNPPLTLQRLSTLPRSIKPRSLELTRLSRIRILISLGPLGERRLVDLLDTTRVTRTAASRHDLDLRVTRCMLLVVLFVVGVFSG
jgi:hypothetical protein